MRTPVAETRPSAAVPGEPPRISVIVPCHGDAAVVLHEQLRALAAQDVDHPWELLLADNGASPATLAVADGFRSAIPGLRVVDARARRGQAYAVNTAVRAAHGEHLL